MIRNVSFVLAAVFLGSFGSAPCQQPQPESKFQKQLDKVDLGVSADGLFNTTVSGPVDPKGIAPVGDTSVTDVPSNTVGEIASIRYVAKPLFGLEFNFVNGRYTQNFSYPGPTFGVQTGIREYTLGYLYTPKQDFAGIHPFVSVGIGTIEFRPTPHGGEGLDPQARMVYYYSLGGQYDVSPHFGLRAGFRQSIFLAPDFGQNYLTILKHTNSYQPTAGFYVRF